MNELKKVLPDYEQTEFYFVKNVRAQKLYPILKWAGGKEQELKYIIPQLPEYFENYYEPFVGGGAVYTAVKAQKYFINDKSEELISLYRNISGKNSRLFFEAIEGIIYNWNLLTVLTKNNVTYFTEIYRSYSQNKYDDTHLKDVIYEFILNHSEEFNGMFSTKFNFNIENFIKELKLNLVRKIKRMKTLELIKNKLPDKDVLDNIETALKSAFYMHFRHIYNDMEKYKISNPFRSAIFLFIRNYAYSGMFRYNLKGEFNVPYGGIGYNRKNFTKKVNYLKSEELSGLLNSTNIENLDFLDFFEKHPPQESDFIFLDPPYDTDFSTYAQNEFKRNDHTRLADYLIDNCKAKWMLIIKNTDFISSLYSNKGLHLRFFDKTYLVSFMNRNDKNVEHLLITNY